MGPRKGVHLWILRIATPHLTGTSVNAADAIALGTEHQRHHYRHRPHRHHQDPRRQHRHLHPTRPHHYTNTTNRDTPNIGTITKSITTVRTPTPASIGATAAAVTFTAVIVIGPTTDHDAAVVNSKPTLPRPPRTGLIHIRSAAHLTGLLSIFGETGSSYLKAAVSRK